MKTAFIFNISERWKKSVPILIQQINRVITVDKEIFNVDQNQPNNTEKQLSQIVQGKFDRIVVAGGDGTLEYHQYPVKSTSLVNSHGEHREGRRGLRNAQDHAREQSYALKGQLKEYYQQQ